MGLEEVWKLRQQSVDREGAQVRVLRVVAPTARFRQTNDHTTGLPLEQQNQVDCVAATQRVFNLALTTTTPHP